MAYVRVRARGDEIVVVEKGHVPGEEPAEATVAPDSDEPARDAQKKTDGRSSGEPKGGRVCAREGEEEREDAV